MALHYLCHLLNEIGTAHIVPMPFGQLLSYANYNNFEHIKNLANGNIPESEWIDYGFEGEFNEYFNYTMSDLYDICDKRVDTKKSVNYKFIWVK